MKSHLNKLSRLQGAGALPFADELLPFAERAAREALEALSPTRCAGCERAGALICQDCLAALTLIDPRHSCTRCGAPFGDLLCTECSVEGTSPAMAEALDRCLACSVYAHPLPRIIKAYKDAGERRLAPYLAELLYDTALHAQVVAPDRYGGVLSGADAVVFVPATAAAFRRRGFDHMEAMRAHFASCRVFLCSMPSSSTGMATSANSVVRSVASVPKACTRRLRTCTAAAYCLSMTLSPRARPWQQPRRSSSVPALRQSMALLSHVFGRGGFVAVKIERRNEPTGEQLAASVILTGASALRMMRAERRQMGYISWKDLNPDEERRVLRTSSPSTEDIYLPDLVRIGAASGEVQEDLCLLVGSAAQRRRMPSVGWSVCSGLPAGSILEVEPGVYSLSPEALCLAVARELGCIQAFALAQELCSKISLSDRGKYLPPYTSPVTNKLAKDKDQPADVGYFEVEPVLMPDRLADYLAVYKGNTAKQLQRLCPYLSENLRSPMECIMLALFSLPFSYGGFACGPFKTDYKIEFDDRAQAISGMPHAVCDAYQEAARFDLEYNGELGHSSRRGRIHDEKRNTGLITMGIEVATVNNEMLCDMEAMEALAWRIHQRMRKRYRNRVDARRKKQEALLNTLRACFGLKPV